MFLEALRDYDNWIFVPERNDINQYDRNYHLQYEANHINRALHNDRIAMVRKRYMDKSWASHLAIDDDRHSFYVVVLAIDVIPYYIEPEILSFLERNGRVDRWVVAGNNYPTYPGTYPHIDRNGTFEIYAKKGKVMISNNPTGTLQSYEHPLRSYVNAMHCIKIAYNSFFFDSTDNISERIIDAVMPDVRQPFRSPVALVP